MTALDTLRAELQAVVDEMKPLIEKERAIRAKIVPLQNLLAVEQTEARIKILEGKLTLDKGNKVLEEKLINNRAKLEIMKRNAGIN